MRLSLAALPSSCAEHGAATETPGRRNVSTVITSAVSLAVAGARQGSTCGRRTLQQRQDRRSVERQRREIVRESARRRVRLAANQYWLRAAVNSLTLPLQKGGLRCRRSGDVAPARGNSEHSGPAAGVNAVPPPSGRFHLLIDRRTRIRTTRQARTTPARGAGRRRPLLGSATPRRRSGHPSAGSSPAGTARS